MKTPNNPGDQPKRTLFTGFDSFDYTAQDYPPKYLDAYLYCHSIDKEHLSKGFLPRCPLLEQIYKDTTVSDMFWPPNLPKPTQSKSHSEWALAAIGRLTSFLNWWLKEKVQPEHPVFWFYAYSDGPCKWRVAIVNRILDDLITKFDFSHPAIAAELKKLGSNLIKRAIDWDKGARFLQKSQCWIDPSQLDPIEVKEAVAVLLYKLRHIGSLVREQTADLQQQANLARKPEEQGPKGIAGYMSSADLAKHHGVDAEALRKRLERHRAKRILDSDFFVESQDRGKNKPKYLYDAEKVLPIIQEIRKQGASVKRPSKRK